MGQYPSGTYDRRAAYVATDAYRLVADNIETLTGQTPLAQVGVYYSNRNRIAYERLYDSHAFADTIQGLERVLRDNQIQYTFVPDRNPTGEDLARFETVVLPKVALMSDEEIALFLR